MSLKGSLQTVALPEVLDFLSGTAKTGELRVDGAGTEGLIWFEEGSIAGVRVQRGPNPVEAVFQLLRIEEGDFSFNAGDSRPDDVPAVDRSEGHVAGVLGQAQERLRQWSEIVSVVPSLDHRVTLAASAPGDTVSLGRSQWELVVAIGEGHSVGEVIAGRGLGEFEGCQAIKGLVEGSLVEIGDPVAPVEEPSAAAEESATAVEEPPLPADEPAIALIEPTAAPVAEPADPSSFGVFNGFAPDGFGAADHLTPDIPEDTTVAGPEDSAATEADLGAEADDRSAAEVEAQADEHSDAEAGEHPGAETVVDAEHGEGGDSPVTEPSSDDVVDRYASLRSVMAEVGQSLEDDPYLSVGTDEGTAMPAFGSPLPYSVLDAGDGHDHAEPSQHDGEPTDAHAALQALLAEVSNEEFAPEAEEAVDGLADRGPWTRNELASFDGWREEEVHAAAVSAPIDETPVSTGDFGQALAHSFAAEMPAGAVEDSEASAAEPEAEEEPAPAEEPINRGLLLKFLSSVRN